MIHNSRDLFTKRIRPPLVIKALLDMKGEVVSKAEAEPLTLGTLERLEGLSHMHAQGLAQMHALRVCMHAHACMHAPVHMHAYMRTGMLERLEGIVKVRNQMKFSVRAGRQYLITGVAVLLVSSFLQWGWEFTKILTYQNRYFTLKQVADITAAPPTSPWTGLGLLPLATGHWRLTTDD